MEQTRHHSSAVAYRRQQQIEDCLYEALKHTPYQSISVADLCRQVGISRKAFYNYYRDKDACFCAIVDRQIHGAVMQTAQTPDYATTLDNCIVLLDYWRLQKDFFDILLRNNLLHFLLLRVIAYVLNEDHTTLLLLNTPQIQADTDILACYMSTLLTLVLQWYFRGFDTPTEEMARKLLRLIHVPLIPIET